MVVRREASQGWTLSASTALLRAECDAFLLYLMCWTTFRYSCHFPRITSYGGRKKKRNLWRTLMTGLIRKVPPLSEEQRGTLERIRLVNCVIHINALLLSEHFGTHMWARPPEWQNLFLATFQSICNRSVDHRRHGGKRSRCRRSWV